ncbi:MAG: GGDEF domain-containing protein [Acidobacteriota bacterium]
MKDNQEYKSDFKAPEFLAFDRLIKDNQWLMKIRFFYTFFVTVFFIILNLTNETDAVKIRELSLVLGLMVVGNLLFNLALKGVIRKKLENLDYNSLQSLAAVQIDFDFVLLSIIVFISGGVNSPVLILYIFYIMISTFIVSHEKSIRNTSVAIILVSAIFFSDNAFDIPKRIAEMISYDIILLLAYFISSHLSSNLRENREILQELLKKTRDLSIKDGLTGLYNQTHFFQMLEDHMKKAKRYNEVFSLLLFDVDNFKNYNDNNGHINGSGALKRVGRIITDTFRTFDIAARYGGDEYVIFLPNTDKIGAFLAGDRLRERIAKSKFPGMEKQPKGCVTISMGIASFPEDADTREMILDKADKALYYSKENGRNKVTLFKKELLDSKY